MLKILSLILATFVSTANAQQANFNYQGVESAVVASPSNAGLTSTTGIAGSFANAVTQQNGRQSCWIQYKPQTGLPVNAATAQGSIFFGIAAPTTLSSAFVLNAYQILNCEQAAEVEGGGVWVSGSATGDIFTIKVK